VGFKVPDHPAYTEAERKFQLPAVGFKDYYVSGAPVKKISFSFQQWDLKLSVFVDSINPDPVSASSSGI